MKKYCVDYEKGGRQKEYYAEDEVISRNCPLCGQGEYRDIYRERGALKIVKCKNCGFLYTNPVAKESDKAYWGDEKKYYEEAKLIFLGQSAHYRDPNYLADLKIIEKLKPEGNFLDVGTNLGFFLRHTRGKKWDVFGVEPSPVLSEMARKFFGLNVKTSYLENAGFQDNFFDVVTMTDVFEHIYDPKKMLSEVRKIMKSDGILFIKVPNGNYNLLKLWLAKMTGRCAEYDIFDSYEHLSHYNQATLTKMLKESGFKIKKVRLGRPIQLPSWHRYVGHYYQYSSPWMMDGKNYILRILFYWLSRLEFIVRLGNVGYFASNIIVIASKE